MRRAATLIMTAFLAMAGCGDDEGGDTTIVNQAPTETVTEAGTTTDGDAPRTRRSETSTSFETPSGNIGCFMSAAFVNCVIAEATWTPPGDPSCPTSAGRFASLEGDSPGSIQCGMPEPPTGEAVLPYGQRIVVGGYRCTSAEDGVTCDTTDGTHRIFLSRTQGEAR